MTCVQGFASQLAINSHAMQFLKFEDHTVQELVDNGTNAIRGKLNHPKERVSRGRLIVMFDVVMNPSPAELTTLLPLAGFTASGATYTLGDTLTTFPVVVDKVSKVHTYANCVMGKFTLSGQRGASPLQLSMRIYGTTLSEGSAGSFSATALDSDIVYGFHEGTLSLGGNVVNFDRFQFTIDPNPEVIWNNSRTATQICWTNREINFSTSTPYGTATELNLFSSPLSTSDGVTGTLAFSRGSQSESIAFANLKSPSFSPSILNKGQIRLPLSYRAYDSGSTSAVIWTHTP